MLARNAACSGPEAMTAGKRVTVGRFDSGDTPPTAIFFMRLLCRFWGLRELEAAGLSVNESDSMGTVTAETNPGSVHDKDPTFNAFN